MNKVDRGDARIAEVVEETYELFLDLLQDAPAGEHNTDALDFPVIYACAKAGRASLTRPANGTMPDSPNLGPLFATILEHIPGPELHRRGPAAGPRHQPGRLAATSAGWRSAGSSRAPCDASQDVAWCKADGTISTVKLSRVVDHQGPRAQNRPSRPDRATS